jgi:hypothetical protein
MAVHRNRFLVKNKKLTDALNSKFIGFTILHVLGSLSAQHQEFLAEHRLWYILCSGDDRLLPGVGWNSNQPFCPSSGVLSRTSALVYFMQL